jgi:hypothetical protein
MDHNVALHLVIVVLIGGAVFSFLIITKNNKIIKNELNKKLLNIITKNIDALSRKRLQLIKKDAYGKQIFDKWHEEIGYFIANHIEPKILPNEIKYFIDLRVALGMVIDRMAAENAEKNLVYQQFREDMTPSEYETFCAEALKTVGWDARVTMQSRDQGVDVVAEKDDLRIVLQCKFYARPVGNKAVQEIVAARNHEQADYGVVVSNNRYTEAAEQLAKTNNILLIHHTDLVNIDTIIDGFIK